MNQQRLSRFCCLILIVFCAASMQAQNGPPADLDSYVARAMKTFGVPGLSVAIVKDGKVVVAKGYGVRKMGEAVAVDENTLFGIGSNTKAFTSAALATLVDEGIISWDDPVYERLRGFQMYDPYVAHEMTIRDLLTHRSGMDCCRKRSRACANAAGPALRPMTSSSSATSRRSSSRSDSRIRTHSSPGSTRWSSKRKRAF